MGISESTHDSDSLQDSRLIPLSGDGGYAIVDAADYERLIKWKWQNKAGGYAVRNRYADGRLVNCMMHRFILDAPDDLEVDHINLNKLDNRRSNLRLATQAQNSWNRPGRGGSSQYIGVTWNRKCQKWQAGIKRGKKSYHLGLFRDEVDAARAYDAAARELGGEFAMLNFPDDNQS